ncbi:MULTISPECIES: iron ABC transporter permease [unclassified Leucobacter]|uniref:FecCD family ABC transporter permease n=1 Tax=unclassified Leucobacter TaxID=2621730 RepID=UPI001F145E0A|nr:iron ABC transporter permease [Leucobacter sp. CX169]
MATIQLAARTSEARPGTARSLALPTLGFALALLVLAAAVVASVLIGARGVGLADLGGALLGQTDTIGEAAIAQRLPRTALAMLVGAALATAGVGLQAVTRNPLADPGILGITSGAALAVVITITVIGARGPAATTVAAIIGAAAAAGLLYALSTVGVGGASPLKIVLAGAAISAMCVSVTSALILPRPDAMEAFRFWQVGGVGGARWGTVGWILPVIVLGVLAAFASTRAMNALALGDELAAGLGERLGGARFAITAGAIVLAGTATAVAGPIGFVGLIVPHLCRLVVGPDHRVLVPLSALVGAALLVGADVLGRVMLPPSEIEAGIITAIIGAPVLIWIVRRRPGRVR